MEVGKHALKQVQAYYICLHIALYGGLVPMCWSVDAPTAFIGESQQDRQNHLFLFHCQIDNHSKLRQRKRELNLLHL